MCCLLALCLVLLTAAGCGAVASRGTPATAPSRVATLSASGSAISPAARTYLTQALDFIHANSYTVLQHRVDWPALQERALKLAAIVHAQTPKDTWPAISFVLTGLGDGHSFFIPPQEWAQWKAGVGSGTPAGRRLAGGIGYLYLPEFAAPPSALARQYATAAQDLIRQIDAQPTCGWIVDLRNNGGGNMGPMLVGAGPILGQGGGGAFVYGSGPRVTWSYQDGQMLAPSGVQARMNGPAYQLKEPSPPVALLFNHMTASAAEAIVVAFQGRPNTRSFGQPTAGVPTANLTHKLSDGAVIALTVALDSDRTGKTYDSSIQPDVYTPAAPISFGYPSQPDPTLHAAITWLQGQPSCDSNRAS